MYKFLILDNFYWKIVYLAYKRKYVVVIDKNAENAYTYLEQFYDCSFTNEV